MHKQLVATICVALLMSGCQSSLMKTERYGKSELTYDKLKDRFTAYGTTTLSAKLKDGSARCGDYKSITPEFLYLGGMIGKGRPVPIKDMVVLYRGYSTPGALVLSAAGGRPMWDCGDLIAHVQKHG